MKNRITNVFLLLCTVAISGCTNPSIHKPDFGNYGSLVDLDMYSSRIDVIAKPIVSNFVDSSGYFLPTNDYKLNCILSYESNYSSKENGDSIGYSQNTSTVLIDNDNYRATYESSNKAFGKRTNVPKQSGSANSEPLNTTRNESVKFYYENVGTTFYIANVGQQTLYTRERYSLNLFTNNVMAVVDYDLSNVLSKSTNTYYSSYSTNTKYYVNGNTFTMFYSEYGSSETRETLTQVTYKEKELIYKMKTIYKLVTSSEKREYVSYVDLTFKIASVNINKLNYSDYTIPSLNNN